jgi:hypothetical protein
MAVLPTAVVVCSESDPAVVYHVQLPYCDCADFRYRRSNPDKYPGSPFCKHICEAMRRVAGWHRQAPAAPVDEVHENLTRQQARTLMEGEGLAASMINHMLASVTTGARQICPGAVAHPYVVLQAFVAQNKTGYKYTVTITR